MIERPSPRPWRVSDAHGLCIRDADNGLVADLDTDAHTGTWQGSRADAELIVAAANAYVPPDQAAQKRNAAIDAADEDD